MSMLFKMVSNNRRQRTIRGGYPFLKIYSKCLAEVIKPHNVFMYIYDILQFSASLPKIKHSFKISVILFLYVWNIEFEDLKDAPLKNL